MGLVSLHMRHLMSYITRECILVDFRNPLYFQCLQFVRILTTVCSLLVSAAQPFNIYSDGFSGASAWLYVLFIHFPSVVGYWYFLINSLRAPFLVTGSRLTAFNTGGVCGSRRIFHIMLRFIFSIVDTVLPFLCFNGFPEYLPNILVMVAIIFVYSSGQHACEEIIAIIANTSWGKSGKS